MPETRDVILYLGAGEGVDLADFMAIPARRLVLVEPNPTCLSALQRAAAGDGRVEILSLAVAEATGRASFHVFNVAGLSSLHRPTDLRELFPGLRIVDTLEVETLSMADLLKRVVPEPGAPNLLIVDTAADAQAVVHGLEQAGDPSLFETVILRGSVENLYEDSQPLRVLVERLQAIGYSPVSETAMDPDFPEYRLKISPLALELKRLRTRLEDAEANAERAEDLAGQFDETQKQLAVAQGEARDAELQRETVASRADELAGQLDEAQNQLATVRKEASEAVAKVADLQATQTQLQKRAQQLETARAQSQKNVQDARQQTEAANDNLAVALRTQVMLQADLNELRERYQEVLKIKSEQQALLDALKPRLQEAARYLQLQQAEAAEPLPETLRPAGRSAATKKSSRKKSARKAD